MMSKAVAVGTKVKKHDYELFTKSCASTILDPRIPSHITPIRIQRGVEFKMLNKTTAKVMDRTGSPGFLWFFCMFYIVMVLNFTALESLGWITPYQACFGVTPDISTLLVRKRLQKMKQRSWEVPSSYSECSLNWTRN
mmetsp:Transcript_34411/g.48875  ORF Transcript_34411/g.48875 Transcript_34411/m.48875 type:complete len:138 (+) Transcript_34411:520-933(+)